MSPNKHRNIRRSVPRVSVPLFIIVIILVLMPAVGRADPISINIIPSFLKDLPGGTVDFSGVITNTSGTSLDSTDFFLNFSGFDSTQITNISQLLGTVNFTLPNNTFSSSVELFAVTLAVSAQAGSHPLIVSLEDINNDLSNTVTVNVISPGAVGVTPEPGTLQLLAVSALGFFIFCSLFRLKRLSQLS